VGAGGGRLGGEALLPERDRGLRGEGGDTGATK
jgi:hypothetical protein